MDELDWSHNVSGIRDRKLVKRRASKDDCAIVSGVFGDAECLALESSYAIDPLAPGRYRVSGQAKADVRQICGVTLDPVDQVIDETFDVEFRSGARRAADMAPDFDAMEGDEPEPIEQGEIKIGRFICEVIASAIDPFPRADNAELNQVEATETKGESNPFAILGQLKRES
jgi:uncharacterized metal-binding protein YceD (DUF177 family)